MAEMANDPDSQYFEVLKNGVPLGVREPPLKSPGIWPTKEELKGESPLDGALETHEDVETMHQRRSMQRIFGRHFWRKGTWTWSLVPLLPRKRHPSVDVTYPNYAQAPWQPLMKETDFALSMMDLGRCQCTHPGQYR